LAPISSSVSKVPSRLQDSFPHSSLRVGKWTGVEFVRINGLVFISTVNFKQGHCPLRRWIAGASPLLPSRRLFRSRQARCLQHHNPRHNFKFDAKNANANTTAVRAIVTVVNPTCFPSPPSCQLLSLSRRHAPAQEAVPGQTRSHHTQPEHVGPEEENSVEVDELLSTIHYRLDDGTIHMPHISCSVLPLSHGVEP